MQGRVTDPNQASLLLLVVHLCPEKFRANQDCTFLQFASVTTSYSDVLELLQKMRILQTIQKKSLSLRRKHSECH